MAESVFGKPIDNAIKEINGNFAVSSASLANLVTIYRYGKLRVLCINGSQELYGGLTLPTEDNTQNNITANCFLMSANYTNVRQGRLFIENGSIAVRVSENYNNNSSGMSTISTQSDRVYGQIIYCVD